MSMVNDIMKSYLTEEEVEDMDKNPEGVEPEAQEKHQDGDEVEELEGEDAEKQEGEDAEEEETVEEVIKDFAAAIKDKFAKDLEDGETKESLVKLFSTEIGCEECEDGEESEEGEGEEIQDGELQEPEKADQVPELEEGDTFESVREKKEATILTESSKKYIDKDLI